MELSRGDLLARSVCDDSKLDSGGKSVFRGAVVEGSALAAARGVKKLVDPEPYVSRRIGGDAKVQ